MQERGELMFAGRRIYGPVAAAIAIRHHRAKDMRDAGTQVSSCRTRKQCSTLHRQWPLYLFQACSDTIRFKISINQFNLWTRSTIHNMVDRWLRMKGGTLK